MRKYEGIRKILLEVLEDRQWHTIAEIERRCEENEIHLDGKRSPIYGVIHRLKKKEVLESDGAGQYRMSDEKRLTAEEMETDQKKKDSMEDENMEENIKNIEKCVENYKRFDWIHCSDEELREVRGNINRLLNLSERIQKEFNGHNRRG